MENYHGKLLGLTATPIRFLDGNRNIAKEFFDGNDIQGVQLSEAIQKKILPTFEYVTALYNLPETKGNNELTEKLYSRLDFLRNEYSFQNILRKHLAGRYPVKAIVFVDSIQEIPKVMDSCREVFPDAVHLDAHSKYSGKENAETYEQFENINGDCFLYVVDILNEGIHFSGANTEIMLRRTRSPIVYLQQLGRILSVSNAENDVIIFDFVTNHMNTREYTKMQNDTVSRLSFDIGDPCRQIVQHDYALEELELLEKLHQLENNLWTTEEDDLMKKYYEKEKGSIICLLSFQTGHASPSSTGQRSLDWQASAENIPKSLRMISRNIIVRKMESTSSFRNIPDSPAQVSPILLTGWDLPFGTASHGQQKKTSS